jgi:hypothetical protein
MYPFCSFENPYSYIFKPQFVMPLQTWNTVKGHNNICLSSLQIHIATYLNHSLNKRRLHSPSYKQRNLESYAYLHVEVIQELV